MNIFILSIINYTLYIRNYYYNYTCFFILFCINFTTVRCNWTIFWNLGRYDIIQELINSKKSSNNTIKLNNISVKVPKILLNYNIKNNSNIDIKEALLFNNNLLMENFITPSRLKMPLSRRILEKYYS